MKVKTLDSETKYDLAVRLYGDIKGLQFVIPEINNDGTIPAEIEKAEGVVFDNYVSPQQPVIKEQFVSLIARENQSIYDVALQLTGKIEGLPEVIENYNSLTENLKGQKIEIVRSEDGQLDTIISRGYLIETINRLLPENAIIDENDEAIIDENDEVIVY